MVNKLTKWIEAKPVATQATTESVIKFMSGVVHHYGMPHSIIADNGSNFTSDAVQDWCIERNIKLEYTSAYNP